jgi:hypothetical protein
MQCSLDMGTALGALNAVGWTCSRGIINEGACLSSAASLVAEDVWILDHLLMRARHVLHGSGTRPSFGICCRMSSLPKMGSGKSQQQCVAKIQRYKTAEFLCTNTYSDQPEG